MSRRTNHRILTRRESDYAAALNYLGSLLSETRYTSLDTLVLSAAYRFSHRQLNALVELGALTRQQTEKRVIVYRKETSFGSITAIDLAQHCLEADRLADKRSTRQWERREEDDLFDQQKP